ncbi:MAG TPA: hypothetical protein PKC29_05815 [Thermodesulfobacteriota bacterium]|nr:hypothetical protein [Thermodesulfobacteriota bacterium]
MRKNNLTMAYFGIFVLALALTLGCRQGDEGVVEEESVEVEETATTPEPAPEEPIPAPAPTPGPEATGAQGVTIEAWDNSPSFEGASTRVSNFEDGSVLDDAKVSVIVDVENFELGVQTDTPRAEEIANSAEGQHAHIILDNDPYLADYKAGEPFDIGVLTEGPHTLVVFPSRSYHESVKSPDAAEILNFYVGKEEGEFLLDKSAPTIIYSRPKGDYKGKDAEKILLDFYLNNVELSPDGYKAKYTITKKDSGEEVGTITLTDWTPAFVAGLPAGEYGVRLQLLDKDGNVVEGAFNDTERAVNVTTE